MESSPRPAQARPLPVADGAVLMQILWITLFAAATVAGARFEIPHQPVPFTLQTFVVLLSGAFLGPRNGALSQVAYLAAGVVGIPVFASGAFGITALFGPTGGYLLAFPAAAALVGALVWRRKSLIWVFFSMASGLALVFLSGTLYLHLVYIPDMSAAFSSGFLLFTWWDLLKLSAAATIYHQFARRWPRLPHDRG